MSISIGVVLWPPFPRPGWNNPQIKIVFPYTMLRGTCRTRAPLLLEAQTRMQQTQDTGCLRWFFAAARGHLDIVDVLVEVGANKNQLADSGLTPLHVAVVQRPSWHRPLSGWSRGQQRSAGNGDWADTIAPCCSSRPSWHRPLFAWNGGQQRSADNA